jgi:hypothetical protein
MLLVLAAGQRASADTETLTWSGATGSSNIAFSLGNGSTANGQAQPGPYFWNNFSVSTFCIELTAGIPGAPASTTFNQLSPGSAPTIKVSGTGDSAAQVGQAIEALYGNYYNQTVQTKTATNNVNNAAFQLALWELIYDGSTDLKNPSANNFFSGGNFQVTTSMSYTDPTTKLKTTNSGNSNLATELSTAQTWLNNTLGNISGGLANYNTNFSSVGMQVVALSDGLGGTQDQMGIVPVPKVNGVPAPPGVVLAGFGLIALLGRGRWNRQTPTMA